MKTPKTRIQRKLGSGGLWTRLEVHQLKEEATLLHTAECGGELADLGRGLYRRAVSGQSHPSQEEAVVRIFYRHCQHLTLDQGSEALESLTSQ